MARKNDSPQKAEMREMMCDYLKNNDVSIKRETDVNSMRHDVLCTPATEIWRSIPCDHRGSMNLNIFSIEFSCLEGT